MKPDSDLMFEAARIALGAGERVMRHYGKADVRLKSDQTPVTQADMESHHYICEQLENTGLPVCSEEGILPYEARRDLPAFWLIDPLDGTKDFIRANEGFSICIALVRDNVPVVGAVFAPALGLLYAAFAGGGAFFWADAQAQGARHDNAQRLTGERRIAQAGLVAAASMFHGTEQTQRFFEKYQLTPLACGSALKICYAAAGLVDLYPRLNGTKEWDTAAADIILRESGGAILACDSKAPLVYNKESVKNPHFIAFGKTQIGGQIYNDLLQGSALVFA